MIRPHPLTNEDASDVEIEQTLLEKFQQNPPRDPNELALYIQKTFPIEILYDKINYELQVIQSPTANVVKVRYSTSQSPLDDDKADLIRFEAKDSPSRPFMQMLLRLFENEYNLK